MTKLKIKAQEDTLVVSAAPHTSQSNLCILIGSSRSILHSKRYQIYQNPLPTVYPNLPLLCKSRVLLRPESIAVLNRQFEIGVSKLPIVPTFTHLHDD
jgi:hypothetical protein